MSWVNRAKVGDRIICLSAEGVGCHMPRLVERGVYTIAGFVENRDDSVALLLAEFEGLQRACGERYGFHPSRFRPVEMPPTDISIFTDMLKPADQRQPVPA